MRLAIVFVSLLCLSLLQNLSSSIFATAATVNNDYPILLMHGFGGWGRDELLGFKYWGGLYGDLSSLLSGHANRPVLTVATGPVSSSWDRVCEAYAQIIGGQVDYGEGHAATFKHSRYGRNYTGQGLYPQWGQINPATGRINKLHIIAHSMGGQDARLLSHLLNHGSSSELSYFSSSSSSGPLSPLFLGNQSWIASITTLSTPHDGTTLAGGIGSLGLTNLVVQLVASIGAIVGVTGSEVAKIYDLKLDQFNLVQQSGESLTAYLSRAFSSAVFTQNYQDISLYDLSPEGAQAHNAIWMCEPDIYYATYATGATYTPPLVTYSYPDTWMFAVFWPFATFMGAYSSSSTMIDATWHPNDGVVNSRSMKGPSVNVHPSCTSRNANSASDILLGSFSSPSASSSSSGVSVGVGIWNFVSSFSGWDHATIIGVGLSNIVSTYTSIVDVVVAYEKTPDRGATRVSQETQQQQQQQQQQTTTTSTGNAGSSFSAQSIVNVLCQQARASYTQSCNTMPTTTAPVASVNASANIITSQQCAVLLSSVQTQCLNSTLPSPSSLPSSLPSSSLPSSSLPASSSSSPSSPLPSSPSSTPSPSSMMTSSAQSTWSSRFDREGRARSTVVIICALVVVWVINVQAIMRMT